MNKTNQIKLHMDPQSGLVYKDESHCISSEAEHARYLTHNNQLDDPRYYAYQKQIFDTFVSHYVFGKILDYGCGEEAPLKAISQLDMACYDLYFHRHDHLLADTYDAIIMIEVIEHIRDVDWMFEKLVSWLNPKGRLIIQTEFKPPFGQIHTWWYIRDETHVSFFDEDVFRFYAQKHGLAVIYTNQKNRIVLEKA